MKTEPQRTCPSCGNEFSGAMGFCPVCLLRKGLAGAVESGESSYEEAVKPTPHRGKLKATLVGKSYVIHRADLDYFRSQRDRGCSDERSLGK